MVSIIVFKCLILFNIGTHIFMKTSGLLNTEPPGRKAIFAHLVISSYQESFKSLGCCSLHKVGFFTESAHWADSV